MTLATGIHEIAADEYHADPSETPSLSASIAKILISRSPAHAWTAHSGLNPNWQPEAEDKFDIGTAAHRLLLEGEDCMAIFVGKDWRSGEAKSFREEMRAANKVPLLVSQAERVNAMVEIGKMQMAEFYPELALFQGGKPEQTLCWDDDHDVRCRIRIDWLHDATYAVDDYKTTTASADPAKWERTMYGMGADVQVAFYLRGLRKTFGLPADDSHWRFVVQESYPPYALSVVTLAPSAMAIANDKVQKAIDVWALCMEKDFWPAYPTKVTSIEVPTWEELRWLEREQEATA